MNWLAWAVERQRQGVREALVLVSADPPATSGRAAVVLQQPLASARRRSGLEFSQRSNRRQLEAMAALRGQL